MTPTLISRVVPDAVVYGDPQLQTDGELVALAFAADGSLWSVEEPGVVRQWHAVTGQALSWHQASDLESLWCFSDNARVLASASNDLSIWDPASGHLLTVLPQPAWVTALAFAPDPTLVATGHDDGAVRFWDVSGHQLLHEFCRHDREVSAVAVSPDGRLLAAAGEDRIIHVWDLADGRYVMTLTGHTDRIPALVWLPDNRHLISAGWDTTARLWDTASGAPVILLNSHAQQVYCLALSHDGALLACADSANAVHIWDLPTRRCRYVLRGADVEARCLAFSPDNRRLACGGGDRIIRLWDPVVGVSLSAGTRRRQTRPAVALSADGRRLALNHGGSAAQVWDVAQAKALVALPDEEPIHALAFSPDGRWVAGGADTHVQLWEAATGRPHWTLEGPEEPSTVLAFSPDGRALASASASAMEVWLWRVGDGEPMLIIPDPLQGCTVEALAFHPAGRLLAVGGIDWLATGGSDGAISLWDLAERCEVATFLGGTTSVAFDPTGDRLASTSLLESISVWDVRTQELLCELTGHDGQVLCVAFSPDGKWLASGGEDRTVRLWDAATGAEVAVRELDTQVRALAFAPDGRELFTGNGNTTCYRLPLARLLQGGRD